MNQIDHRIKVLERKVRGLQLENAKHNSINNKQEKRIRDLEIKTAVSNGVPQKKVAEIYELSAARVSQIARKAV